MLGIGPSFLFFLASTTLNTIALHCIRFGVSWLVMKETGSAAAFAVIFSASSLIEVYSKPILSPMADYFDRLKVYRACVGIGSAVVTILLATVLLLPFSILVVTILLMTLSLVAGLRDPASAGLVPALVNADRLTEAQSLRSTVGSVVSLGAPMLSALLLSVGGTPAALSAAAIVCVIGLITTCGVKLLRADAVVAPKRWSEYLKTWHLRTADGVRAVVMTRSERTMAIVVALTNAGLFPFFAIVLPLWVAQGLRASATTMAIIEVAFGAGIFAGSTLLTARLNVAFGRFFALVVGNGLLGAALLTASLFSNAVILGLCFAVAGAGFAVFNVNASTLRAAATPAAFRSRMAAGVAFLSSCLNPFATQAMGFVVEGASTQVAVALCGLLILVSTLLLTQNADAKGLLVRTNEDIVGAYATLYPLAFIERQRPA
jgi:MFS family permease